jgi:peptidoglycan/LPS O-acetylase OafA/YrhL
MLIGVVTRPRSVLGWLLESRPMRWLGERSYSIYLWNVLAQIAILHALGHTRAGDVAWIAMFVVLAEVSFRLVERPLRAKLAGRSAMPGPPQAGPGTRETERDCGTGTTSIKGRFTVTLRSQRPGG